ncbi:MAG: TadE/TadG family type IV pilus assembly protein [Candidatus Dormibacteria bacterium]
MVEFALVGGLFFFLVFSVINAGFFLYGRGAVEHAADVGMATIAAEGDCSGAGGVCAPIPTGCANSADAATGDEVAICRMDQAGLTTTALIKVTGVQVWLIAQNSNGSQIDTCNSGGMSPGSGSFPCNAYTCGVSGTLACENQYNAYGTPQGTLEWPASQRNVSTADANFGRLVINFQYSLLVTPQVISMSTSNVFRLEPQQ